ncbi:hypothetical protein ABB07_14080 [Streptomyces incarnatus]|uniref:Uncharacterized protein n=1 Tax=Streptomyces incarnatus TaxID=665007 RepID=A0ABM5TJF1_9ACTN|nr:hypothetical protein ABB07_14080 [Streptomyces incarnatus]
MARPRRNRGRSRGRLPLVPRVRLGVRERPGLPRVRRQGSREGLRSTRVRWQNAWDRVRRQGRREGVRRRAGRWGRERLRGGRVGAVPGCETRYVAAVRSVSAVHPHPSVPPRPTPVAVRDPAPGGTAF